MIAMSRQCHAMRGVLSQVPSVQSLSSAAQMYAYWYWSHRCSARLRHVCGSCVIYRCMDHLMPNKYESTHVWCRHRCSRVAFCILLPKNSTVSLSKNLRSENYRLAFLAFFRPIWQWNLEFGIDLRKWQFSTSHRILRSISGCFLHF